MGVSISSDTSDGTRVGITLEKTDTDKGTVQVQKWSAGQDPQVDAPTEDETTLLYDIRGRTDGSEVVCKGDVPATDPDIKFLVIDDQPPIVRVTIVGTLFGARDGVTDYQVSDADATKIKNFVVASGFPDLA